MPNLDETKEILSNRIYLEIKPKLIDNITFYSKIKPNQINLFTSLDQSLDGIIDISCKYVSWFEYVDYNLRHLLKEEIQQIKNILQTPNIDQKIEEKVVWALECFPTMPSHNMEDLLNILYITKKYKIEDKWLVYNIDDMFKDFEFSFNEKAHDIYFYGIKK